MHAAAQQAQGLQEYDRDWQSKGGRISKRNDAVRENLTDYIREKTKSEPGLFEKLLPVFAPLCRRLIVDNGFYDALIRDNVELVRDGIDTFTENGIRDKLGKERKHDVASRSFLLCALQA